MFTATCLSHSKVCHNGHLMPMSHGGSCRSSHLSQCPHSEDLCPPSLQQLCSPFSQTDNLRQASVAMVESSASTSIVHFHENESETDSFLPATAAICLLNFTLSVRSDANGLSSPTQPVLNSFLTPVLL